MIYRRERPSLSIRKRRVAGVGDFAGSFSLKTPPLHILQAIVLFLTSQYPSCVVKVPDSANRFPTVTLFFLTKFLWYFEKLLFHSDNDFLARRFFFCFFHSAPFKHLEVIPFFRSFVFPFICVLVHPTEVVRKRASPLLGSSLPLRAGST